MKRNRYYTIAYKIANMEAGPEHRTQADAFAAARSIANRTQQVQLVVRVVAIITPNSHLTPRGADRATARADNGTK